MAVRMKRIENEYVKEDYDNGEADEIENEYVEEEYDDGEDDNESELEFGDIVDNNPLHHSFQHSYENETSVSSIPSWREKDHFHSSYTSYNSQVSEANDDHYEPQVGVIPPSLQALIVQAQAELRTRKVPEEHKAKFKPTCVEASEIGRFTRLNEVFIEAYGTKEKEEKPLLPSETWQHGNEKINMPTVNQVGSRAFTVFKEAATLGKMKRLKPQVVTNYDPLAELTSRYEIDLDDENKHKVFRTAHLTEMNVQQQREEREEEWETADLEEEEVHYASLDEVKLPTEDCPVYKPETRKMSHREMMDLVSQAVAESAWERRYRLERPKAQQRIKMQCRCKYCKRPNPYQTMAYRKKWLIQQGLWKEERS